MFTILALVACGGPGHDVVDRFVTDSGAHDTHGDDTAEDTAEDTGWVARVAQETDGGHFWVRYEPNPDPIPLSTPFSLLFRVSDAADEQPVDATITLDVDMPAHGHGMTTVPRITPQGSGNVLVEDMYFQMRGWWRMEVSVTDGGTADATTFYVECCD